jgi:hypothetical protein
MPDYTNPKRTKQIKAAILFVHGAGYLQMLIIIGAATIENICFIIY